MRERTASVSAGTGNQCGVSEGQGQGKAQSTGLRVLGGVEVSGSQKSKPIP